MGITSLYQEEVIQLVKRTRFLALQERKSVFKNGLNSMCKRLKNYSVVWESTSLEVISEVEQGFDEPMAIDRVKQSPGFKKLLFIRSLPLSEKDILERDNFIIGNKLND